MNMHQQKQNEAARKQALQKATKKTQNLPSIKKRPSKPQRRKHFKKELQKNSRLLLEPANVVFPQFQSLVVSRHQALSDKL
jgi:hypothetical protein